MLLHVLPYVDRDAGEAAALELWHSAENVARHADGSEGWGGGDGGIGGWDGENHGENYGEVKDDKDGPGWMLKSC